MYKNFKTNLNPPSTLGNPIIEKRKLRKLARLLKVSNKEATEMIGSFRVLHKNQSVLPKDSKEEAGSRSVEIKQDLEFGMIKNDTSIFEKVLETLLEGEISRLEKKGIEIDVRLKTISIKECLLEVITFHNHLVKHNRIPFCFTFFKEVTSYCIQLLESPRAEHPRITTPRLSTGPVDRWPTVFQLSRPLFFNARDRTEIGSVCDQILRSMLNVHRLCEDFNEISLASITTARKPIDSEFLQSFEAFVIKKFQDNNVVKSLEWNPILNLDLTKNGPNGVINNQSCDLEALKLLETKRFSIPFKRLCELTDNLPYYEFMIKRAEAQRVTFNLQYENLTDKEKSRTPLKDYVNGLLSGIYLRKLTSVPDTGHKSRTIAMSDYWTQTILRPVERDLVQTTIKLYPHSCDYFSHSKGFNRMFKRIKIGDKSYDCKDWTDCFRVELQEIVVRNKYSPEIADCWKELVVKCPWNVKNSTQTVRYAAGQGMGTRGSFQVAQLTSCLLMDYIFVTHYNNPVNGLLWGEVGDDMVCHDPDGHVLKVYSQLDIPINLLKSKQATGENLCMEYVSRNVNFGSDVSRISARTCLAIGDNLLNLTGLILHLSERTNSYDFELLFSKLLCLETSSGKPRWKFPAWSILFKTLVVNNIIYPDDLLGSIVIPLSRALKGRGFLSSELNLFGNIEINEDISSLLRLAILENICNKISKAGDELNQAHIESKGIPFPPIDPALVDAIVRRAMKPEGIPSKFPWHLIPEIHTGQAIYHYLLAVSNQKYHKFIAEFFGSGILNGKDFLQMDPSEKGLLLIELEKELSRILISITPRQINTGNPHYNLARLHISYSYSLLRNFKTDLAKDQFSLKFISELEIFKEFRGEFSSNPIVVCSLNVPDKEVGNALVPLN